MANANGRLQAGQPLNGAISASKWNDLCDAADIVHGRTVGTKRSPIEGRTHLLCKTSAAWTKNTAQTVKLYGGEQGSEQELSSEVKAWNKFADIDENSFVMLARVGSGWYVISAECGA